MLIPTTDDFGGPENRNFGNFAYWVYRQAREGAVEDFHDLSDDEIYAWTAAAKVMYDVGACMAGEFLEVMAVSFGCKRPKE